MCAVFSYKVLSLMRRETPKFGADLEGVYSTQQLAGEVWACSPERFIVRHSGCISSQF